MTHFCSLKIYSQNKNKMKTKKLLTIFTIISVVLMFGCEKNDTVSSGTNPIVIPLQTTVQATVPLASTSNFGVLAGSAVTSTGATTVTGDLGLSPGSSVGGFPPGILNGTQHINDVIANQAKLDLTTAYNDAAGRTCTDIVTLSGNIGGLTLTP